MNKWPPTVGGGVGRGAAQRRDATNNVESRLQKKKIQNLTRILPFHGYKNPHTVNPQTPHGKLAADVQNTF